MIIKVTLPIASSPIVCFLRWSFTLAIVRARKESDEWFSNEFTQLACTTAPDDYPQASQMVLDFWRGPHSEMRGNNPFLESRVFGFDKWSNDLQPSNLMKTIVNALADDFYPMLFVNEARMQFSPEQHLRYAPHHILVYGFDPENEQVHFLGMGKDQRAADRSRFGHSTCSFEELGLAVSDMREAVLSGGYADEQTFFLRYRSPNSTSPEYPIELRRSTSIVRDDLAAFLNAREARSNFASRTTGYVYGIEVYAKLEEFFRRIARGRISSNNRADLRHLQVIEEHYKLMSQRIQDFTCAQYIADTYKGALLVKRFNLLSSRTRLCKVMLMKDRQDPLRVDFNSVANFISQLAVETRETIKETLELFSTSR